ncbi:MAG: HIT domain-containing protein [Chloroflexi bacterium]|nr:MAG: HIT domain-containing protein [Chloroflexota bacterium]
MKRLWTPWRMPYLSGEDRQAGEDLPSGCIFCAKPQASDEAEHILCRGQHCYVTLNKYPYNNGHLMVIPYRHVASTEDLEIPALTEMMVLTNLSLAVLRRAYHPHGFNLGINLGEAAGAGIAEHVHLHIVPRWRADTNFMPIIGETRVIPEMLEETYRRLRPIFDELWGDRTTGS